MQVPPNALKPDHSQNPNYDREASAGCGLKLQAVRTHSWTNRQIGVDCMLPAIYVHMATLTRITRIKNTYL